MRYHYRCAVLSQWENHSKSLSLETYTRQKIVDRINQKVNDASGTWIDWQYLLGESLVARPSLLTVPQPISQYRG